MTEIWYNHIIYWHFKNKSHKSWNVILIFTSFLFPLWFRFRSSNFAFDSMSRRLVFWLNTNLRIILKKCAGILYVCKKLTKSIIGVPHLELGYVICKFKIVTFKRKTMLALTTLQLPFLSNQYSLWYGTKRTKTNFSSLCMGPPLHCIT